jgi:hypothetical protein
MSRITIRTHIDDAAVERALFGPEGHVRRVTNRAAKKIARRARALAPVRTGRLRKSITVVDAHRTGSDEMTAEVVATAPYSVFVHEGTRRHLITARTGKALRFASGGQLVFSHSVDHPGTSPNRFLLQAATELKDRDLGR